MSADLLRLLATPEEVTVDSDIAVRFEGPFSWPGLPDAPSVFEADEAKAPGIYLWTVPVDEGYLVYYVGETGRTFRIRLLEHYKEHAACMYHVYSPTEFAKGRKITLWPGHYDSADRRSVQECIAQNSALSGPIGELTEVYRFFLARTSCGNRIRRRVEAALASALYTVPEPAGSFQDMGIRYDLRREDEDPLRCTLTASELLIGLPHELLV